MKRKVTKSSGFAKLKAGLQDAIAYHRGNVLLTVRDVEMSPPPPMRGFASLRQRSRAS
jgi:hypothetical protein